ncbi:MAG: murein biosynthesis integral membrane protein MurJ [Armatimonadetes bacterium]|nr:murein biosynthesis integral membrane protein MurJ [Armatimonadota bacterium]
MAEAAQTPNVAKAGGIMMASLFLSRILGIVRESVINARFGQSSGVLDAYYNSFRIPDLLFFLIAGGALSSAFIPVFTELIKTDREDEAWHLFSSVVTIMSAIVTVFIVAAWVFAEPLIRFYAHDPPMLAETVTMSRIVLPGQYAFFIGGLMMGTLYARQVFSVPGLSPNIYNLGIIFGALFLTNFVVPSAAGMSWGALVGAFLGNILLPWYVMRQMGSKFSWRFDTKNEHVRKVFKLMLPVVLGLSLPGVFVLILGYYANAYGSKGIVAAFTSGNQIMQAPLGMFGQSLAIAAFPALSQFFAQKRMDAYRDQLVRTLRLVFYLSAPVAALMLAGPTEIVRILLEHGRFTAEDTARTVPILQLFAIGIPAWCLHPVLMRAFFSIQQSVRPIVVGTATTLLFVALCVGFQAANLPHPMLALAGSLAAIVMVVVMVFSINKQAGPVDLASLTSGMWQATMASAAVGGAVWLAFSLLHKFGVTSSKIGLFLGSALVFILAAWAYYFVTKFLKMPETAYFNRALRRRSAPPSDG